jgi:hypothetical protein
MKYWYHINFLLSYLQYISTGTSKFCFLILFFIYLQRAGRHDARGRCQGQEWSFRWDAFSFFFILWWWQLDRLTWAYWGLTLATNKDFYKFCSDFPWGESYDFCKFESFTYYGIPIKISFGFRRNYLVEIIQSNQISTVGIEIPISNQNRNLTYFGEKCFNIVDVDIEIRYRSRISARPDFEIPMQRIEIPKSKSKFWFLH